MTYLVTVGNETFRIEITKEDGSYRARTDHGELLVDARDLYRREILSLLVDGVPHDVLLTHEQGRPGVFHVLVRGWIATATVQDEIWAQAAEARTAQASGMEEILAPMPGLVVALPAAPGAEIAPGATVAIVEAMKMQNELASEHGGRVEEVRVEAGQTVEAGQVLAVIRREDAS